MHSLVSTSARRLAGIAIAAGLAAPWGIAAGPAHAAPTGDWPCIQVFVPRISGPQVWSGPALDPEAWKGQGDIQRVASKLAARRLPVEEAGPLVDAFAEAQAADQRAAKVTALFGRTLELLNRDRASIVAGIHRFTDRQRGLTARIQETQDILQQDGLAEDRKEALTEQLIWDTRLLKEREHSLKYLCEQPVLLEQRAFALGRLLVDRLGE